MRELMKEDLKEVTEALKERHPLYYSSVGLADIFPFLSWMPCFKGAAELKKYFIQEDELNRRGNDSDLEFNEYRKKKKAEQQNTPGKTSEENKETGNRELLPKDRLRSDSNHSQSSAGRREKARAKKIVDTNYKDFSILGFGTYSFFYLMEKLMLLFLILSVIAIVNMMMFGYLGQNKLSKYFLDYVGIGNLGFATTHCKDIPLEVGKLTLDCPSGLIEELTYFGITPDGAKMLDACMPNEHTKMCDGVLNQTYVKESIVSLCYGKKTCTIDAKQFISKGEETDVCRNNLAQFYAQVSCKFDANELKRRDLINKAMVFQVVVSVLLLLVYFHYTHSKLKSKFKEWDKNTTTIEDFTVKCEINQQLFDNFILKVFKPSPNENPIYAFKTYLRDEISKIINQGNVQSDALTESRIVDIEFTFSNILLLELMQSRAHAIEEKDEAKRIKIEGEIIKEYSKNHFVPKVAFIIFETEDAYQQALKLGVSRMCCIQSPEQKINGVGIIAESPFQPTNTEWENCHKTKLETFIRIICASLLMGVVILIGFGLLYVTEYNKEKMHETYPVVDCTIVKMESGSPTLMKKYALLEWWNIYKHGQNHETIKQLSTSNLQCFCDDLHEEKGWNEAANEVFSMYIEGRDYRGKICKGYLVSEMVITFGYILIPIIIEIINLIVKIFIHVSSRILKFENKTYEECVVFLLEFLLTFFDSTLLILLINANFEGTGIFLPSFDGHYTDFSCGWYLHVAPIFLFSMFLKMIIPLIKFISIYTIRKLLILFDKRGSCWQAIKGRPADEIKVKKPTSTDVFTSKEHNNEYVDLHSGTNFKISSPFAKVMCMVFMCFMFGLGQPIMYPCTLIFIVAMYCFNKLLVVYWFRKPPKFNDSLAQIFVSCIKYGALLYCAFSFWVLTNRQMFDNEVHPIETQEATILAEHSIWSYKFDQTIILFALFIILIIYMFLYDTIFDVLGLYKSSSVDESKMEKENLHNFYQSLSNKNLNYIIDEEKLIREKYGKKKLFDATYDNLIKEHELRMEGKELVEDKILFDLASYQFHYQPEYCEEIGYTPVYKRNVHNMDSSKADLIDNSKRVFDYPYFGEFSTIKNDLFFKTEENQRNFES